MESKGRIRVLLINPHQMIREGLVSVLERDEDVEVVGESSNALEAQRMVRSVSPDVMVLDVEQDGVDAIRELLATHREARVVAITADADQHVMQSALKDGAHSRLFKSESGEALRRAVRAAAQNQQFQSAPTSANSHAPGRESALAVLGTRECEVLRLLSEGKTSGEIAREMHISVSTVETHRRNLMRKLKIHSVAELTKLAVREGLTTL